MKRIAAILTVLLFLFGCNGDGGEMERAVSLRNRLAKSSGCEFDAVITADYGEKIQTFSMHCQSDALGNVQFTVIAPSSIQGITGTISEEGGKLTFDDQALAFELLADGQIAPVSAPWILVHTLLGGYLTACGEDGEGLRISIDDSYKEDPLHIDIWTNDNDIPIRGEVLWQGRRILSLEISNFKIL